MKILTALLFLSTPIWADGIPQGWTPDPNIQYTVEPATSGDGCNTTASSGMADPCATWDAGSEDYGSYDGHKCGSWKNPCPIPPSVPEMEPHHPKHHLGRDPEDMNTPEPGTLLMCGTALIFGVWRWRKP